MLLNKLSLSIFIIFVNFANYSFAEQSNVEKFDDYEVHYSVFNTSFLTPQVAQTYNIIRSKSKALMNIAILKKQTDGTMKNVTAVVSGERYDLIQTAKLEFSEVREQEAIYYLSSFEFQHKTTLYFTLMIQPDPNKAPYKLQFNKLLYKDE